jgi:hypothetical protein
MALVVVDRDPHYTSQGATFSASRVYRYRLWRTWGDLFTEQKVALWLMLNPSTADEHVLDPTLRRCEGFSRAWGCSGFIVANIFAYRSTDPKGLYDVDDPVGPDNDRAIVAAANDADLVVCGWGAEPIARTRAPRVSDLLRHVDAYCLGTNADGSPKHPLYLAKTTPLQAFDAAEAA